MKTLLVSALVGVLFLPAAGKDESAVDNLVKQHLASIGAESARAAAKTRVVEGTVRFRVLSGGDSQYMRWAQLPEGTEQMGKEVLVSQDNKMVSLLKLAMPSYHGERFVTDGRKNMVSEIRPGVYSDLGEFVHIHDEILTEGLWGGTLSTGWALAHLKDSQAKIKDKGMRKIENRQLRVLQYVPAKRSDLEIELFFDPETMRHVMTRYSLTISPQMGHTDVDTARQYPTRYEVEEQFLDFERKNDLQLPKQWLIRFTENVAPPPIVVPGTFSQSGRRVRGVTSDEIGRASVPNLKPFAMEFHAIATSISDNVSLDPKNFEVK